MKYGSIWARIGGGLIDLLIVLIISAVLLFCWGVLIGIKNTDLNLSVEEQAIMWKARGLLVGLLVDAIYTVVLQTSNKQATLGQSAFDLIVVKNNGEKANFGQVLSRYLISIPSSLIFKLGYVIAIFTKRKQTLHDLIANTVVIEKNEIIEKEELVLDKKSNGGKEFIVFITTILGFILVAYIIKN
jgi:uncharacterized RDD family membrane protein YckC